MAAAEQREDYSNGPNSMQSRPDLRLVGSDDDSNYGPLEKSLADLTIVGSIGMTGAAGAVTRSGNLEGAAALGLSSLAVNSMGVKIEGKRRRAVRVGAAQGAATVAGYMVEANPVVAAVAAGISVVLISPELVRIAARAVNSAVNRLTGRNSILLDP